MAPTVTDWEPVPFTLGGADVEQPVAGPSRIAKAEAPALDALAFWETLGADAAALAPPATLAAPPPQPARASGRPRPRAPDIRSNTSRQGPIEAHATVTARYNRTPIEYRAAAAPPLVGRQQANALREEYRINVCFYFLKIKLERF